MGIMIVLKSFGCIRQNLRLVDFINPALIFPSILLISIFFFIYYPIHPYANKEGFMGRCPNLFNHNLQYYFIEIFFKVWSHGKKL